MDLVAVAETSRIVVACAVIAYISAWLAFSAELSLRARLRTAEAASPAAEPAAAARELAAVGAGGNAESAADEAAPIASGDDDIVELRRRAETMGRIGRSVMTLATVVLAIGVAMRAIGTERAPWGNMYEFSITGALVASIVFLVLARTAAGRAVAAWVVLLVFVTLGLAVTFLYVEPGPLTPALRHYWLIIHVGMAVTAFGLFTVSAVVSALQIVAERRERRGSIGGRFVGGLPASSVLDRLAYRLTAVAFPIWTFGPLILGAVWAEVSWGRYWGWDPKEVWALITWLAYAGYLHARATAGWKGTKASVVALIGFATVLFSYFGVNIFFSGEHSYGGL